MSDPYLLGSTEHFSCSVELLFHRFGENVYAYVLPCALYYQAAKEEVNGHMAVGPHAASAEAVATNSSSPASSSPSLASLELLTDDMYAPNLEISLGRQDWTNMEQHPEELSLKYL